MAFVLILLLTAVNTGALDAWPRSQTQPQTLHGLMVSIDDRLQSLEYAKWGSTLREVEQKLEFLEAGFRRLDSTFQDKMDKLERNLNSKELKDELMVEKLSHKMRDILDTSYDQYGRRLGYAEERLEMSMKKTQMSIEGVLGRLEKQQEDIQTDVTEVVTIVDDLKAYSTTSDDKLNTTHKAFQEHIQSILTPNREELQRIFGSLENIGSRLNGSLTMWGSQNDGPQVSDVVTSIRAEINSESNKVASKLNNMYNEMWRRVVSIESLLKELGQLNNLTRRDMLDQVQSLVPHTTFPSDSLENFLEVALEALERKLQKLGRNIEDRMDTLTTRQDLVLDSCFEGGICRGLESRLSQVLEKIFDIFSDKIDNSTNRTLKLDGQVTELMELVKTQHSHLLRTITHNTKMVVTLAKDSSDATKLLHTDIAKLSGKFENLWNGTAKATNVHDTLFSKDKTECKIEKNTQELQKNLTEIKFMPLNKSEQLTDITEKQYNVGVIKITSDNIMSDNATADRSIMNIVSTISPNLTSSQFHSLLLVLNNSINFGSLEAIIQNTEADSIELYGFKNITKLEEDITEAKIPLFSGENANNSDDTDNEGVDKLDSSMTLNITFQSQTIDEKNPSLIYDDKVKEAFTIFGVLWKIRNGFINATIVSDKLKNSNESEADTTDFFIGLDNLCYGLEKKERVTSEHLKQVARSRLLLIKFASDNKHFYEEIENICNTLGEPIDK